MVEPIPMTLSFLYDDSKVLLGFKKRGRGAGKWNGFGGKINLGESVTDAAIRELKEEIGITAHIIVPRGHLQVFYEEPLSANYIHLFEVQKYSGIISESEEMRPAWFVHGLIPYDTMWNHDKIWFPHLLEGKSMESSFWFADEKRLKKYDHRVLSQ